MKRIEKGNDRVGKRKAVHSEETEGKASALEEAKNRILSTKGFNERCYGERHLVYR